MNKTLKYISIILLSFCMVLTGCTGRNAKENTKDNTRVRSENYITMDNIPAYSGSPYIAIEDNVPSFDEKDLSTTSFEHYSELDFLGRCGTAFSNIGQDLMPTEKRDSIGQVKPSGWQTIKYDHVDGKYLYNRCHLIGYQLTAENANEKNLITGTRYLNIEGMLPFENMVADYIKETGNHVLYRVTPVFEGNNLVASGVHMEGYSVEDQGEGISFNVYAYNVQPGVIIDYKTGESKLGELDTVKSKDTDMAGSQQETSTASKLDNEQETATTSKSDNEQGANTTSESDVEIRGNKSSMIYHCPGQASYENMGDSKNLVVFHSEQEAIDAGYRKAKR